MLGYALLSAIPPNIGRRWVPSVIVSSGSWGLVRTLRLAMEAVSLKQGQDPALPPHPGVIAGYSPGRGHLVVWRNSLQRPLAQGSGEQSF